MPVQRHLPTEEAAELLGLTRELAREELAPRVDEYEAESRFPREVFTTLGKAGLLGLPYDERYGGGGQPYEVYLQVVEELATVWASVAEGVSVHTLACFPLAAFGTDEQRERWLPDLVGGELLGAYCLSEPQSGSDAAALTTKAVRDGDDYVVDGTKAWITHGGEADFYSLLCRTSTDPDALSRGISCLLVDGSTEGVSAGRAGTQDGLQRLDHRPGALRRRPGRRPTGCSATRARASRSRWPRSTAAGSASRPARSAWPRTRSTSPSPGPGSGGSSAARCSTSRACPSCSPTWRPGSRPGRALYLEAARRRDRGEPFGKQAAMAKLFCTDMAMRVTTDAVQVLGGYGYVRDFPVERLMREAKALQIVEGTNQMQRMVIGRHLQREPG